MKILTLVASLVFFSLNSLADDSRFKAFGDKKVYYSAFNSSFLSAEIANIYKITRGDTKGLVNISVVPDGSGHGTTALVAGSVNNLLQQQQTLAFEEIREGEAVYYIAPFTFDSEDPLTFTINVRPAGGDQTHTFSFKRTLYAD